MASGRRVESLAGWADLIPPGVYMPGAPSISANTNVRMRTPMIVAMAASRQRSMAIPFAKDVGTEHALATTIGADGANAIALRNDLRIARS